MSEKHNFRNIRFGFKPEGSYSWFERARSLRAIMSALAKRRFSADAASPLFKTDNAYLKTCCERAIDAFSVEDAAFWHSEIVSELSVEILLVDTKPWPERIKAQVVAELREQQDWHALAAARLARITGPLVWRP